MDAIGKHKIPGSEMKDSLLFPVTDAAWVSSVYASSLNLNVHMVIWRRVYGTCQLCIWFSDSHNVWNSWDYGGHTKFS